MSPRPKRAGASRDLPKGIRATTGADGRTVYIATSGSGARRQQLRFNTLTDAIAWKTVADDRDPSLPPLTRNRWKQLSEGEPQPRHATPALVEIPVRDMIDQLAQSIAAGYKTPAATSYQARLLTSFLEDIGAGELLAHEVDGKVALKLPEWLHNANYGKGTQRDVLRLAERIWEDAARCRYVERNDFRGLKVTRRQLGDIDRRGASRSEPELEAWSAVQLAAIAFLLHPAYRLPFWLCALLGLRRSELLGLQLGDWDSEARTLYVQRQRRGSATKGSTTTKTTASVRLLPVGNEIAAAIDDYIEHTHGNAPRDRTERAAWNGRYLLIGRHGGPMDGSSFAKAVANTERLTGLIPCGPTTIRPLHQIRKSIGGVLQDAEPPLSGKAVSRYLGHDAGHGNPRSSTARVTKKHYWPAAAQAMDRVAAHIDRWVSSEVLPCLGGVSLLDLEEIDDGIPIETAAKRLNEGPVPTTVDDVRALIAAGALPASRCPSNPEIAGEYIVVSANAVNQLLANRRRVQSATYSAAEAAAIFGVDHRAFYRLAEREDIREVPGNARQRVSARGYRTGFQPGGGRRFNRQDVERVARSHADAITRRRDWLKVGEVAELLGVSDTKVRSMGEAGDLEIWRDETSTRHDRYVSPNSVRDALALRASVRVPDAAKRIGCGEAKVRGLVKMGELRKGLRPGTVLESSIDVYLARAGEQASAPSQTEAA